MKTILFLTLLLSVSALAEDPRTAFQERLQESPGEVLSLLEEFTLAEPAAACDCLQVAVAALQPSPEFLAEMVTVIVMREPMRAAEVRSCAIQMAPEAESAIRAAVAQVFGEAVADGKNGKGASWVLGKGGQLVPTDQAQGTLSSAVLGASSSEPSLGLGALAAASLQNNSGAFGRGTATGGSDTGFGGSGLLGEFVEGGGPGGSSGTSLLGFSFSGGAQTPVDPVRSP
ncbi:MAG: hypothetical protein AAF555_08520 [Verrucomicrobiota bacterium]